MQLRGWHKAWEYLARLRRDGRISYDGVVDDSTPTNISSKQA